MWCGQWALQTRITLDAADGAATTLSWGAADELLVGSRSLALWTVATAVAGDGDGDGNGVRLLWRRRLANAARLALFSADASLAASVAAHDRLVKIWWKIAIGADSDQAAFAYLPHPRAVEALQWRQPLHPAEATADNNVLYTITADQLLRVWAPVHAHDAHLLQLWAVVDLCESIPHGLPGDSDGDGRRDGPDEPRHALIVDRRVFCRATEHAVATAGNSGRERDALQRLTEVASRSPELVLVLDARGRMGIWGLENVGCGSTNRSRKTTNCFGVVQVEDSGVRCGRPPVRFSAFAGGDDGLVVLMHSAAAGRITWMEARLDRLLDPMPDGGGHGRRFRFKGVWTGHDGAIRSLVRTADGRSILSSTEANKHLLWTKAATPLEGGREGGLGRGRGRGRGGGGDEVTLHRQSALQPSNKVERAVILNGGMAVKKSDKKTIKTEREPPPLPFPFPPKTGKREKLEKKMKTVGTTVFVHMHTRVLVGNNRE